MKEERKYQEIFSDKCTAYFCVYSEMDGVLYRRVSVITVFIDFSCTVANTVTLSS